MTTASERLKIEFQRLVAEGLDEQADRLGPMLDYLGRLEDAEPDVVSRAISLATGHGFAVFPAVGKQPEHGLHWPSKATTNAEEIAALFAGKPERNIGISCKRSGLVVVDEDQVGGMEAAAASVGATVPETYSVATGKGRHYYFRAPDDCRLGNAPGGFAAFGCDIRGPGERDAYGGYRIHSVDADRLGSVVAMPCGGVVRLVESIRDGDGVGYARGRREANNVSNKTPIDVTTRDFDAIVDTVGPVAAAEIAEWVGRFDCCDVRVEVTPIDGGGVDVCANHRPGCPRERS